MKTNDNINGFKSLLEEKNILNAKLKKVYELALSEAYDEALFELDAMGKRYPNVVDIYHIRFKIYCIKENYKLADKVLNEAEILFSENEKIIEDRIYLRNIQSSLKNFYLKNEQYEELAECSEAEIKNSKPENIQASSYYYRALSYRMMNDKNSNNYYRDACRSYKNLTNKKEDLISSYLYKALCHKDMKEYGEALKIVNTILQEDAENKEAMKIKISIIKELKSITK